MTTFTGKPDNLLTMGPIVPVKLAVPTELQSALPPIETFASIDTAYPYTFIQEGVASRLGLVPHRLAAVTTPTRYICQCNTYRIRIEFPDGVAAQLEATEVPFLIHPDIQLGCILGRGLLSVCVFTYDGPANTFTLKF